jgi:DNA repair exonuclease SbcCD ATPase subunit/DNA repair exonuclease SbcCD nuclease subunit
MNSKHLVKTKLTNVKTIIHLADIHVRLYKRHNEYQQVLNELYGILGRRDLSSSAIVVAGDVVHAKTDMSPEMVQVVSSFLTKLSELAPTIVIPGNHDLNLSNPNRLDALSPIIDNLSLDELHYFRESGIYQFANIEFGVHSIIGTTEDWPSVSDMSGTKIALYHAPVNQAQTDVGYTITNRVTVANFDGYDMVMLGDIHKTQILQEKTIGKPEIAYAGSLIQQNHGESPSGHGFLVWDVATSKIEEFVEVPNKFGYYTLTLTDKTIPPTTDMPENVRLRMFVGDIDDTFVKKVISVLRKDHNIIECTINRTKSTSAASAQATLTAIDNMNDVAHQNAHIRAFIENELPNTAPDLIDKICDINTSLNNKIGEDELPRNISWKPLMLEFDNLFSYGAGNKINFENMSGLYGVFSPNATGKTSAFDAMCFALYDKTPRAFKGSHIMNTRKDDFSCTLTLLIENKNYVIERTGSRKKNGEVKVDVNFYCMDGDNEISLNGEDRRDTNAAIRSYVGTYEDFILTALSVQNQNNLFIETGQSDRKDLLSQFIGLTVFDRLLNLANDEMKEVVGALKSFKKTDFTQKLADVQTEIQELTDRYTNSETDDGMKKVRLDQMNIGIDKLREMIVPVPTNYNDITMYAEQRNEAQDAIDRKFEIIANLESEFTKVQSRVIKAESEQSLLGNYDDLLKSHIKYKECMDVLTKMKSKFQALSVEERHMESKIKKLNAHKYDPNCKYCIANVFVIDAKEAEASYYKIRDSIIKLEDQILTGETFSKSIEDVAKNYDTWTYLSGQMQKDQTEWNSLTTSLNKYRLLKQSLEGKLSDLDSIIAAVGEFAVTAAANKTHEDRIGELQSQIRTLDVEIAKNAKFMMELYGKISVLKAQKEDMMKSIKDAEELETTYEAYETYISVIGRDGLPYKLIGSIIPTLQLEVNNILEQIVDFTISLDVDGKNINGRIIYDDERMWPLELASGMERFIGGLAIRIALMSISSLPKSNFLVIDEGLGVLDADNLSSMTMMFDILSQKFDFVILISHLEATRDIAENLIEIKRDDGYSQIIVD